MEQTRLLGGAMVSDLSARISLALVATLQLLVVPVRSDEISQSDYWKESEVVRVFVEFAEVRYKSGDKKRSGAQCGIRYEGLLIDSYATKPNGLRIVFVTAKPLKVGAEYLIFLSPSNPSVPNDDDDLCGPSGQSRTAVYPYALEFKGPNNGLPMGNDNVYLIYDPMTMQVPTGVRTIAQEYRKCNSADDLTSEPMDESKCPLVRVEALIDWISLKKRLSVDTARE